MRSVCRCCSDSLAVSATSPTEPIEPTETEGDGIRSGSIIVPPEAGTICPFVFHRNGERIRYFRAAWANACKAAGCPGALVHDMRRSAVRTFERAGVPRSVAMSIVGHKTESIYRRYAIVDEAMQREAAARPDA